MEQIEQLIDEKIRTAFQNYTQASLKLPRHTHNNVDSLSLDPKYFLKYQTLIAPNVVVMSTNGTTPVNIFPNGLPFNLTYTSIVSIAKDGTAGNIILSNNTATVATIAKGTTAGVCVGASSIANTVQLKGTPATVVSSTAGNSFVIIYFNAQ